MRSRLRRDSALVGIGVATGNTSCIAHGPPKKPSNVTARSNRRAILARGERCGKSCLREGESDDSKRDLQKGRGEEGVGDGQKSGEGRRRESEEGADSKAGRAQKGALHSRTDWRRHRAGEGTKTFFANEFIPDWNLIVLGASELFAEVFLLSRRQNKAVWRVVCQKAR